MSSVSVRTRQTSTENLCQEGQITKVLLDKDDWTLRTIYGSSQDIAESS